MDDRVHRLIGLVEQAVAEHDLFPSCSNAPELLMVSGGSDSTAMCLLVAHLAREGIVDPSRCHVLHVDHGLRGEDSTNDAIFVERLAAQCGFSFHLRRIDVSQRTAQFGGNVESAARYMRYELAEELLDELCEQAGAEPEEGRICAAHTRDDRIETFFMRAIVGTGPGGFASIAFRNGRIVRPLLETSRSQLRDFIEAQVYAGFFEPIVIEGANAGAEFSEGARLGLWREDATNFGSEGFRAFVRNELIPLAKTRNPSLDETLSRTIDAIADENEMLQRQVEAALTAAVGEDGTYDALSLAELESPLLRRAIYTLCKRALP
ncbi:MAG: tRNA lysidine(34) synthetase TilS, partial [bacterium]|nr:tRNA lysidine(34) synthetase TilS [bacterium]